MAKPDTFVVTMVVKIDKAERYDVCDVEDEVRCLFLDFGPDSDDRQDQGYEEGGEPMTTDPRECPSCKRMVSPELRDGVPVWKWHGTLTLTGRNTMRACGMSGRPIKPRRTKLGHQIQKAIATPTCISCDKPLIPGLNTPFCSLACEESSPDPFEGFREPADQGRSAHERMRGEPQD